jgi:hypothetical protein
MHMNCDYVLCNMKCRQVEASKSPLSFKSYTNTNTEPSLEMTFTGHSRDTNIIGSTYDITRDQIRIISLFGPQQPSPLRISPEDTNSDLLDARQSASTASSPRNDLQVVSVHHLRDRYPHH